MLGTPFCSHSIRFRRKQCKREFSVKRFKLNMKPRTLRWALPSAPCPAPIALARLAAVARRVPTGCRWRIRGGLRAFRLGEIFPHRFLFRWIAFYAQHHDSENDQYEEGDDTEDSHGCPTARSQ